MEAGDRFKMFWGRQLQTDVYNSMSSQTELKQEHT